MSKPKRISYELIDPKREPGHQAYRLLDEIREEHHDSTASARIALAWRKRLKPDVDGHLVLGRCVKASDLQRELVDWDFVILLNQEVWEDSDFTVDKRKALLDHELCHAERALDKDYQPKVDTRGRPVWCTRKHDIEEFQAIVERHGTYKSDLERFAEALLKRKQPQLPLQVELHDGTKATLTRVDDAPRRRPARAHVAHA
jgi:hypothetical protein